MTLQRSTCFWLRCVLAIGSELPISDSAGSQDMGKLEGMQASGPKQGLRCQMLVVFYGGLADWKRVLWYIL